jgi:hypothetical protein
MAKTSMNRLLGGLVGALLIAALAGCSSGPVAYGGIQRIDPTAKTVTLFNGTTYTVDAATDLTKLKVGDEVRVAYALDPTTKKNVATSISIYQP